MTAANSIPDAGVRSSSYYVARATARCLHCGLPTCLLALVIPHGHEILDDGDTKPQWRRADANAFLFYVERFSADAERRLHQVSRHFRPARSRATHNIYWANHCQHCGTPLEDHELHCEPGGAFMPSTEAAALDIELLPINDPLQAAASGYAFEPDFFSFMRRR